MKAEAWGQNRVEKIHLLGEAADLKIVTPETDGSVSITFTADEPFGVKGSYYVRINFTASEVDRMHRESIASSVKGQIERSTPKKAS